MCQKTFQTGGQNEGRFLGVVVHPGDGSEKTTMNAVDVMKDAFRASAQGDFTMNEAGVEDLCHVLFIGLDGQFERHETMIFENGKNFKNGGRAFKGQTTLGL